MANISKYVSPVSADAPSGVDLLETGALYELESLTKGKPETQFSAAEEADWRAVQAKCEDLLAQSHDLRVGVTYAAALLRNRAFPGFADALAILRAFVENFWADVHPRLDPDDDNDPQERSNALAALATPIGSGDYADVLATLHKTPIAVSRQVGKFGLDAILANLESRKMLDGSDAPSMALVDGAFADTDPELLAATKTAVESAIESVKAIVTYFTDTVGVGNPGLNPLLKDLGRVLEAIASRQDGAASEAADSGGTGDAFDAAAGSGSAAASPARARDRGLSGEINSREEVIKALDLITAFYNRNEPSSPVPLFIERVKKIVPMSFGEIVKELTPDAMDRVTLLTGYKPPKEENSSGW
ncbi:MAG: type VI secretion system protein TssA [Puniceicoccales bacterium]|jgi:type VI secretion system protein ImpA|nr:type VI secretion system protein TssA [Puniceicoccales bacterium]